MSTPDLASLLGFRRAQIMQHIWTHGPVTARELHTLLAAGTDASLSYKTVTMSCSGLRENGLLDRERVAADVRAARAKQAYVYRARVSEAEFLRNAGEETPPFAGIPHHLPNGSDHAAIDQLLVYLGTLSDPDGHAITEQAPATAVTEEPAAAAG